MAEGKCDVCEFGCSLCSNRATFGHSTVKTATVEGWPSIKVNACATCCDYHTSTFGPTTYTVTQKRAASYLHKNYWYQRRQFLVNGGDERKQAMVDAITMDIPDLDDVIAEKWPNNKIKRPRVPLTQRKPPVAVAILLLVIYCGLFATVGSWALLMYPLVWGVWMLWARNVLQPIMQERRQRKWKE